MLTGLFDGTMSGRILFVGMETIFGLSECKQRRSEGVTEWNDGTAERSPWNRQMGTFGVGVLIVGILDMEGFEI